MCNFVMSQCLCPAHVSFPIHFCLILLFPFFLKDDSCYKQGVYGEESGFWNKL